MWKKDDSLECEYIRTMQKNEIVLYDRRVTCGSGYYGKMLTYNKVPGILSFSEETSDTKLRYRYTIGTKQSLAERCVTEKISYVQLESLIRGLAEVVARGREYLVDENDYVLSPESIFLGGNPQKVYLCCYPFLQRDIRVQLTGLFEYFLSHIDYQDLSVVKAAYELYMKSKTQGCGFADLLDVLRGREEETNEQELQEEEPENKPDENREESVTADREEQIDEGEEYCLLADKKDQSIRIKVFPCYIGNQGVAVSAEGGLTANTVQTRISRKGACIYIEDMKSDGGTFVNGRRLAGNEIHKLNIGDSVMLADRSYRFVRID